MCLQVRGDVAVLNETRAAAQAMQEELAEAYTLQQAAQVRYVCHPCECLGTLHLGTTVSSSRLSGAAQEKL